MNETKQQAASFLGEGVKLFEDGKYDDAITELTSSIAAHPSDGAHDCRGCAYLEKGEYDKAIADLQKS